MKKLLAVLVAAIMVIGVVPAFAEEAEPVYQYTYRTYMGADPLNWNPHAWEMNNESDFMGYIQAPLVDITIAEDGVNFTWIYEMATAVTDITADFADKAAWGIDADSQYIYQIDLNPDAKWEDGTPITADDYVYSMQQLLDPAMKNYRANSYYGSDEAAVRNAEAYFNNDKAGQPQFAFNTEDKETFASEYSAWVKGDDGKYTTADGAALKFALTAALPYLDGAALADYADYFPEGVYDQFAALADADGLIDVTDDSIALLLSFITSDNWGNEPEEYLAMYSMYAAGVYEAVTWEQVGFLKTGDYQLVYILQNPCSEFNFLVNLGSNWLVNEPLYEAGKSTVENLVATTYATSMETYSATGPYKISSFEKGKQIILVKNENWFGYTDGKHEGQYQADRIIIDIVGDQTTAMMLFQQGNLDDIELTSNDMATYRMSDYLLKTDTSYTFRYIFASDLTALEALEAEANDGGNKRVLSYDDFRKALSLSIDRSRFCLEATPAYKPAYYLLNTLYYTDIENDSESQYRYTTEAMEAVLNLYGITYGEGTPYATVEDAYSAVTGYDVEEAKAIFQSVYEQAIADGIYTDGQPINITCMCSAATTMTADDTRQCELLNEMVAAATVGTGFEGKITFTFQSGSSTRYDDVANGRVEMIRGAWGGAYFYPFSTIRVYCEPDYMGGLQLIHESCGWNPGEESITINIDGADITDTLQNWAKSINAGGAYAGDAEKCLKILSALETGVLRSYQCIPFATEVQCTMFSQKVEFATLNYNVMYGYGGLRLMTFLYTDAEWDAYVAECGGVLDYE